MRGLFGGRKKKAAKPKQLGANDAIQHTRNTIETLEKREAHLEKQISQLLSEAKARNKKGDKKGAIYRLKRKKLLEKELQSLCDKKLNLEKNIITLDSAIVNQNMVGTMNMVKNTLAAEMKKADVDTVDEVMDDMAELMDQQNEINEALGNPMGEDYDEDELADELADLEDEIELEDEVKTADVKMDIGDVESKELEDLDREFNLPDPGEGKPKPKPKAKTKEDEELDELNALLN